MSQETLFTRIGRGEVPADMLYEDEHCFCITDINPQAPTHLLLIPRKPLPRLVDASQEDAQLLGHLMLKVGEITRSLDLGDAFRVIVNNGEAAGQTVFHLHLHILAEKKFSESSLGFK